MFGMKTLSTVITERGQVSIPAAIRKRLNLTPGMRITWSLNSENQCVIKPVISARVVGAKAMLGFASTFNDNSKSSDEWLSELREGENS